MPNPPLPSAEELYFAYLREKNARKQSELVLQTKTRQAYLANEELKCANIELHQHQRATIQHEKLAALGTLIAGMAHEINNPLAYVISNIHNLREYVNIFMDVIKRLEATHSLDQNLLHNIYADATKAYPKLGLDDMMEDSLAIFDDTNEGLKRVKSIVLNLKNFARNDDNSRSKHNIHTSIEAAITILGNELKNKCKLSVELQPVPLIFCSANALTQVLINLLTNALQAFQANKIGTIVIRCFQEYNQIFVSIRDTGCGMDEEVMKNIFVPFFTTKPFGVGTGLGLPICYEKIKDMGGDIEVESEKDVGTTFTLIFPLESRLTEREPVATKR